VREKPRSPGQVEKIDGFIEEGNLLILAHVAGSPRLKLVDVDTKWDGMRRDTTRHDGDTTEKID